MQVLEKILEEIDNYLFDKYCIEGDSEIERIIRSHMDDGKDTDVPSKPTKNTQQELEDFWMDK